MARRGSTPFAPACTESQFVMAGLVPAIHAFVCRQAKRGCPAQVYGLERYLTAFGEMPDTSAASQEGGHGLAGDIGGGGRCIGALWTVRKQPANGAFVVAAVRGGRACFRGSLATAAAQSAPANGPSRSTNPFGARRASGLGRAQDRGSPAARRDRSASGLDRACGAVSTCAHRTGKPRPRLWCIRAQ